jgi:hypothetical protein
MGKAAASAEGYREHPPSNASSILNGMLDDAKPQSKPQSFKELPSLSSFSEKTFSPIYPFA